MNLLVTSVNKKKELASHVSYSHIKETKTILLWNIYDNSRALLR